MGEHKVGDSFVPGWPRELAVPYSGPYRAKVVEVHDGDTLSVRVSLGFGVQAEVQVRLYGINAPELSTPEGIAARDFLRGRLPAGTPVRLTTLLSTVGEQQQSFTRYVGMVEYGVGQGAFDVAVDMVAKGHAYFCDRNLKPIEGYPAAIRRWVEPSA